MNETHENIGKENALQQMKHDRELILKGAMAKVAEQEGVSVKQVQLVETTQTKKNWYGKIIAIETVYGFRIKP